MTITHTNTPERPRFLERRRRRSSHAAQAVRYQLEAVRDRGDFPALVLADDQGLVVAAAGDPELCEELAAHAPLIARATISRSRMTPRLRGAEVEVRPLHLPEGLLHLACVGGPAARDALLDHSARGVQRILAQH